MKLSNQRKEWKLTDVVFKIHALNFEIPISLRQICEGVFITGNSGSGKTSGMGNQIGLATLQYGCGMLGLCAKPDEAQRLSKLAAKAGREEDVIYMRMNGKSAKFNFLESLASEGADAVVGAFKAIGEALSGIKNENEWVAAAEEHLFNLVKLFILAGKRLEVSEFYLLANDFEAHAALLDEATNRIEESRSQAQIVTLKNVTRYFQEWKFRGEKTRSSVLMSLTPTLTPFIDGPLREIFCTETTFSPRELRHGKILLVDIPCIGTKRRYGVAANTIMKYMMQRMCEEYFGDDSPSHATDSTRPVIIMGDECHYFLSSGDTDYVTTSRSARGAMVYLTQDINNFFRRPGDNVREHTYTLLNNMHGLRVFHRNSCADTFKWFCGIVGQDWREKASESANFSGPVGGGSAGASISMEKANPISERDFLTGLANGGEEFGFVVTGILQQAKKFGEIDGGKPFVQVAFQQMAL